MNYEEYNDMYYDDTYEDEAIIECALDIYDQYEVSMEEAIDIAMEKVYRDPGGHEIKELGEKMKELRKKDPYFDNSNSNEYWDARDKYDAFWEALRNAKTGGNNDPGRRGYYDRVRKRLGDFGYNNGKNALRKIKFKDTVIDRDKRRINPKTGIAVGVGAGAAALGAGGVALYKYRKKKLAEAAKAQREAEKEEAKAAMKREEAEKAVAQAKEASIYFDYD